jgi:hypothetical protein
MTDLTITALITRQNVPGGPLADLNLNDHSAYDLVSYGPGGRTWVFDWASAPSVHGEQPVSGRMGNSTAPVAVRVKASTRSTFQTRCVALVTAFSQLRYHLKFSIDSGTVEEWASFAANISSASADGQSANGAWDLVQQMAKYQQVYLLQVPRSPVPITGVL